MPTPPRTLSKVQSFLKKIGITQYEQFNMPIMSYLRMEHLKDASKTKKPLIRFAEEVISGWKMISDREIKGTSFGEFSIENGVGILEGDLVTELNQEQKELGYVHTGFVAIKSSEFYPPVNAPHMDAIMLRVKTDKRLFLCQIKTLSPWEEDLYQGLIPIPTDEQVGQWRDVIIPYDHFHLTFRGYLEEPNLPFDGRNIKHIGFMMAERKAGPFRIEIDHVSVCAMSHTTRRYTGLNNHLEKSDEL